VQAEKKAGRRRKHKERLDIGDRYLIQERTIAGDARGPSPTYETVLSAEFAGRVAGTMSISNWCAFKLALLAGRIHFWGRSGSSAPYQYDAASPTERML